MSHVLDKDTMDEFAGSAQRMTVSERLAVLSDISAKTHQQAREIAMSLEDRVCSLTGKPQSPTAPGGTPAPEHPASPLEQIEQSLDGIGGMLEMIQRHTNDL